MTLNSNERKGVPEDSPYRVATVLYHGTDVGPETILREGLRPANPGAHMNWEMPSEVYLTPDRGEAEQYGQHIYSVNTDGLEVNDMDPVAHTFAGSIEPHRIQYVGEPRDPYLSKTANDYRPEDEEWMRGQCAAYADGLCELNPNLRLGIHWNDHFEPDEEDEDEEPTTMPAHYFAHDDNYAYDAMGRHPRPYNDWDRTTYDHDPEDVWHYGMHEGGYVESAKEHAIANDVFNKDAYEPGKWAKTSADEQFLSELTPEWHDGGFDVMHPQHGVIGSYDLGNHWHDPKGFYDEKGKWWKGNGAKLATNPENVNIYNLNVDDQFRGKGVGKWMFHTLWNQFPNTVINHGVHTPESEKMYQNLWNIDAEPGVNAPRRYYSLGGKPYFKPGTQLPMDSVRQPEESLNAQGPPEHEFHPKWQPALGPNPNWEFQKATPEDQGQLFPSENTQEQKNRELAEAHERGEHSPNRWFGCPGCQKDMEEMPLAESAQAKDEAYRQKWQEGWTKPPIGKPLDQGVRQQSEEEQERLKPNWTSNWHFADKLNDFLNNPKSRPDLQTPEGQHWLNWLKDETARNPHLDPLTPWLTREWKKGRIKYQHDLVQNRPELAHNGVPIGPTQMGHWADFYRSKHPLRRELGDIMQHDVPSYMRTMKAWDDAMEEEKHFENLTKGHVVHAWPDGWTIQKLHTPEELDAEGDAMGHCVGSYGNDITSGRSSIYSLRDPKGIPHVTTEIEPQWVESPNGRRSVHEMLHDFKNYDPTTAIPHEGKVVQIEGQGNGEPKDEYKKRMREWFETMSHEDRPTFEGQWDDEAQHYFDDISDVHNHDVEHGGDSLYAPKGEGENEYGLKSKTEVNWHDILMNHRHDNDDAWNERESAPEDIYELARAREEIPELAKHFPNYMDQANDDLEKARENNWHIEQEHVGEYPEEHDPEHQEKPAYYQALKDYEDRQKEYEKWLKDEVVPYHNEAEQLGNLLRAHKDPQTGLYLNQPASTEGTQESLF